MKKLIFGSALVVLMLISGFSNLSAQNNGPQQSKEARSIAALQSCVQPFRGPSWQINATLVTTGTCPAGPATTGLREEYVVSASFVCRDEICPQVVDVYLGTVVWCAGQIDYTTGCN